MPVADVREGDLTMFVAVLIEHQFEPGRWLCCRRNKHGWTTVETDHPTWESAEAARKRLQATFDVPVCPVDPNAPRQLVLGFYTDEDAA